MELYVLKNGQQVGPLSESLVKAGIESQDFALTDLAWHEGLQQWVPLSEIYSHPASTPPPLPTQSEIPVRPQQSLPAPATSKYPGPSPSLKGCAIIVVIVIGLLIITVVGSLSTCDHPNHGSSLQTHVQASLERDKQIWFNDFHPIGDANHIELHDVERTNGPNGPQIIARFTIYWSGPLTKDGYTKVQATYDEEIKRWTRGEVIDTNGITTTQVVDGVATVIGYALENDGQ